MVIYCVAYGCKNEQDRRKISFHGFPFKRPEILKLWINAINRENWQPSKTSRICGTHFLETDFQIQPGSTRKILKPDAVPSIFSYTNHLVKATSSAPKRLKLNPEKVQECAQEKHSAADFTNTDFKTEAGCQQRVLKPDAVHSVFTCLTHLQKAQSSRRVLEPVFNNDNVQAPDQNEVQECAQEKHVNTDADSSVNVKLGRQVRDAETQTSEVEEIDNLPKQVCSECLSELVKLHCFKNKCHQIENILKLMSQNVKAETIFVEPGAQITSSDVAYEEQSGLEGGIDDSILNIADLETDLENKVINVDDAGRITVLTNATVQIIDPAPTSNFSDNQLSSDFQIEHQYSRQLNESDESHINIKQEIEELEELFKCKICQENFTSKKLLMDHAKRFKHSQGTKHIPKGQKKNHSRIRSRRYANGTFKCKECDTVFNNRYTWKRHVLEHKNFLKEESGVNLQCKICHENFTTRELLKQHARKLKHYEISDDQMLMCEICAKNIRKRKFKEHMYIHTQERQYICEKCGASFYSSGNLRRHIARHTGQKPHICDICGKGFTTAFCMNKHKEAHNKEVDIGNTDTQSYVCKICSFEYKSLFFYNRHLQKHKTTDSKSADNNEQINKSNNKTTDSKSSDSNEQINKLKNYHCELCNKTFVSKAILKHHGKIHGDKNFLCTTCGKKFSSTRSLANHRRNHERQFKCHICWKSFSFYNGYEIHLRTHTGQRPYSCKICNNKFIQRQHLKVHMITHTRERLHQCTFCQKSFAQKYSLKIHMRIHTGDKPFKCPECDRGFIESGSRRRHRIKHHGLLEKTVKTSILTQPLKLETYE